jgi:catechol 2,3-dioxygenase-like lactoylglutathione lyase family enzyme
LGFLCLEVTDLDRSVTFYRDVLRFQPDEPGDAPDNHQAAFRAGDLRLLLREAGGRQARGRGVKISVEVSGVDAYHDALVARGLAPTPPADELDSRSFSVRDPDGYSWSFRQSLA